MKKDKCVECGKETTSYVNILTGKDWKYEVYCLQCARVFFSYLSNNPDIKKLNLTQLNQCSYEYDMTISNDAIKMRNDGVDYSQLPMLLKELQKRKANGENISLNDLLNKKWRKKNENKK